MPAFGLPIDITAVRPIMLCDDGVFSKSKSYVGRNDVIDIIIEDEERCLPPYPWSASNLVNADETIILI